jgi:hypothetical protein
MIISPLGHQLESYNQTSSLLRNHMLKEAHAWLKASPAQKAIIYPASPWEISVALVCRAMGIPYEIVSLTASPVQLSPELLDDHSVAASGASFTWSLSANVPTDSHSIARSKALLSSDLVLYYQSPARNNHFLTVVKGETSRWGTLPPVYTIQAPAYIMDYTRWGIISNGKAPHHVDLFTPEGYIVTSCGVMRSTSTFNPCTQYPTKRCYRCTSVLASRGFQDTPDGI